LASANGKETTFLGGFSPINTNNSRAQKTYEALGMKSEHYTMYEWLKEY